MGLGCYKGVVCYAAGTEEVAGVFGFMIMTEGKGYGMVSIRARGCV